MEDVENIGKPAPVSSRVMSLDQLLALPEPLLTDPHKWLFGDAIDRALFRDPLPYGRWTCRDGTQVLFNRSYVPLWRKPPDLPAEQCERHWVSDRVRQEFFGDDCRNPSRDPATLVHCLRALAEWDVPGAAAALKRLERKRRAACARRTARVRRQGARRVA
jgi:hypothetical protein